VDGIRRAASIQILIAPFSKRMSVMKFLAPNPGRRLITITNSSLPTYRIRLTAVPEAGITIAHDFACTPDREKPCREGFGKGPELQSRFKLETADAGNEP
jgi:hypothetical protein